MFDFFHIGAYVVAYLVVGIIWAACCVRFDNDNDPYTDADLVMTIIFWSAALFLEAGEILFVKTPRHLATVTIPRPTISRSKEPDHEYTASLELDLGIDSSLVCKACGNDFHIDPYSCSACGEPHDWNAPA